MSNSGVVDADLCKDPKSCSIRACLIPYDIHGNLGCLMVPIPQICAAEHYHFWCVFVFSQTPVTRSTDVSADQWHVYLHYGTHCYGSLLMSLVDTMSIHHAHEKNAARMRALLSSHVHAATKIAPEHFFTRPPQTPA